MGEGMKINMVALSWLMIPPQNNLPRRQWSLLNRFRYFRNVQDHRQCW